MKPLLRDYFSDLISAEYEIFLAGLIGAFATALDAPDPTLPVIRRELEIRAARIARFHLGRIYTHLKEGQIAILEGFRDPKVRPLIDAARELAEGRLLLQTRRDIDYVLTELNRVAIEISLRKGQSFVTALIRARRDRVRGLSFAYVDTAGRKWSSGRYVRTIARAFFVSAEVDASLAREIAAGRDLVRVRYPERHKNDGLVLSISGASGEHSPIASVRDEIFHPNTMARLEAV